MCEVEVYSVRQVSSGVTGDYGFIKFYVSERGVASCWEHLPTINVNCAWLVPWLPANHTCELSLSVGFYAPI